MILSLSSKSQMTNSRVNSLVKKSWKINNIKTFGILKSDYFIKNYTFFIHRNYEFLYIIRSFEKQN